MSSRNADTITSISEKPSAPVAMRRSTFTIAATIHSLLVQNVTSGGRPEPAPRIISERPYRPVTTGAPPLLLMLATVTATVTPAILAPAIPVAVTVSAVVVASAAPPAVMA